MSRGGRGIAVYRQSLSAVLEKIKPTAPCERIAIADLLLAADDRAFAALLFLFAVPNVLPTPPGTSSALGVPLILLSAQLALGRRTPWLPEVITHRSVKQADFVRIVDRLLPLLRRLERARASFVRALLCELDDLPSIATTAATSRPTALPAAAWPWIRPTPTPHRVPEFAQTAPGQLPAPPDPQVQRRQDDVLPESGSRASAQTWNQRDDRIGAKRTRLRMIRRATQRIASCRQLAASGCVAG